MTSNVNLVDLVAERIQKSTIGEIIKEEDLYDIVKQALDKVFFTNRQEKVGYHTKEISPVIYEVVQKAFEKQLTPIIEQWMVEHGEILVSHFNNVIEHGIIHAAERVMAEKVRLNVKEALQPMVDEINKIRTQNGQMQLYV